MPVDACLSENLDTFVAPMNDNQATGEGDIKQLIRGLMSNSDRIALPAYKRMFEAGVSTIPLLERELGRIDLAKVAHRKALTMVVGLVALLHDLDEAASESFIERATAAKCHPVLTSAFRVITRYSHRDYRRATFADVAIFEEATVDPRHNATPLVKKWLSDLPPIDLKDLSRIYIVATKPTLDFYGTYLPTLRVITLVWETRFDFLRPGKFPSSLFHSIHRRTLYHEIGHHVHDHKEFGQDPQQEIEADTYESTTLRRTNPIVTTLTRAIGAVIRRVINFRLER